MPGICTSAMRHSVRTRLSDLRKASAQGNTSGVNPAALIKLIVASRTDSSSSTIEITGLFGISILAFPTNLMRCTGRLPLHVGKGRLHEGLDRVNQSIDVTILWCSRLRILRCGATEPISHSNQFGQRFRPHL